MGKRVSSLLLALVAVLITVPAVQAQQLDRDTTLDGRPNLNGVWKAINTAHWNLEAHSAEGLDRFWQMGAIAAIPAGKSVLKGGGSIPYLPDALAQRDANRASWPQEDPRSQVLHARYPPGDLP